jgi:hypothetical protein
MDAPTPHTSMDTGASERASGRTTKPSPRTVHGDDDYDYNNDGLLPL